jgi:glycosyltransferase involved in cell wall biosynthesis
MRVTFILPARDASRTIDAAVASLAAQTVRDFHLLAIDDGSTDDTGARLEAWARRDPRVEVLATAGVGLVGALNLGLSRVTTPLLARMDADDESLPTRLEKSLAALEAGDLAGVGTGVEIFRDDRPPSPNLVAYGRWLSSLTSSELVFRDRFVESPLCHPSMTLRTAAVRELGGWRDGAFPEDWELWLRLMEAGHRLSCVPEVLHRWRDHDRRLTRQDERYSRERHLDLKAEYLARRFPAVILWGATDTGRGLSKRLRARGVEVRGFIELDPRKLGQRIHDVPVVAPAAIDTLGPGHVLSCVAAKGARDDIRGWLRKLGRVEGEHFTVVA